MSPVHERETADAAFMALGSLDLASGAQSSSDRPSSQQEIHAPAQEHQKPSSSDAGCDTLSSEAAVTTTPAKRASRKKKTE